MVLIVNQHRGYLHKHRVSDRQYQTLKDLTLNTGNVIFYNAVIQNVKKKSRIRKFKFFKILQNFITNLDVC